VNRPFPDENVRLIARHGSIPLIYWSPWDKPYVEGRGPDKYSLTSIIAGETRRLPRPVGRARERFRFPAVRLLCQRDERLVVPWSGVLYGGSKVIPDTKAGGIRRAGDL